MTRTTKKWLLSAAVLPVIAYAMAACTDGMKTTEPKHATSASLGGNSPVTGADFTTVNEDVDGTGHCKNGNPNVNCNIYDGKQFVWLSGGPIASGLGDGTYFFAVLEPGGQGGNQNPNDGTDKNLSDLAPTTNTGAGDAWTNRVFTISNGVISYSGTHDFANNKIRLMPYDDTPNPGGVYIMAICSLADAPNPAPDANPPGVDPSDCKYDAFKVTTGEVVLAAPPTVAKDAVGSYDEKFNWTIAKAVDKTLVKQVGGTVTFTYTVTVQHDAGTISGVKVTGTITVTNPNADPVGITGVTDHLSDGTVCTVTGGGAQNLPAGDTHFAYSCSLAALPGGQLDNIVDVTWPDQILIGGDLLNAGSASFTASNIVFTGNQIDETIVVNDSYAGTLGTVTVGDPNPKLFTYTRSVPVPAFGCANFDNTASFVTNDTGTTFSASQTVTVCGPVHTGALTMGFWRNKNGQAIITSGLSSAGVCNSGTWLRQFNPFQDLSATATCAQVAAYVTALINAANASGAAMNAMLKAQDLATSLDVYFSDPALGGNKIGAPAPVGGFAIDLTKVCKDIATCSIYENVSSSFGGASSLTVAQMLAYASSQSNLGGSIWYAQVKAAQELAKDAFDAINNQVAFAP